ncbi:unnamed protein product, partial [Scytosiphon promiscuus]
RDCGFAQSTKFPQHSTLQHQDYSALIWCWLAFCSMPCWLSDCPSVTRTPFESYARASSTVVRDVGKPTPSPGLRRWEGETGTTAHHVPPTRDGVDRASEE